MIRINEIYKVLVQCKNSVSKYIDVTISELFLYLLDKFVIKYPSYNTFIQSFVKCIVDAYVLHMYNMYKVRKVSFPLCCLVYATLLINKYLLFISMLLYVVAAYCLQVVLHLGDNDLRRSFLLSLLSPRTIDRVGNPLSELASIVKSSPAVAKALGSFGVATGVVLTCDHALHSFGVTQSVKYKIMSNTGIPESIVNDHIKDSRSLFQEFMKRSK